MQMSAEWSAGWQREAVEGDINQFGLEPLKWAFHINVSTKLPHTDTNCHIYIIYMYEHRQIQTSFYYLANLCLALARGRLQSGRERAKLKEAEATGNCQLMQLLWQLKPASGANSTHACLSSAPTRYAIFWHLLHLS